MILKNIVYEDFINYKLPSMFLIFPTCTFKCGAQYCQNKNLINTPNIEISIEEILNSYSNNPIARSIVCGGMEPLDSWKELKQLFIDFRKISYDPFVIYTGYTENEADDKIESIQHIGNLIVKYGRYVPFEKSHYDKNLGVYLQSDNQFSIHYNPEVNNDNI